jgi:type I restriction enzyme, S subunit
MSSESSMGFAMYDAMKPSGIEWFGEIPAHWQLRRLKATVRRSQNGLWGDEPNGRDDHICVRVADFDRLRLGVDISEPTYRSFEKTAVDDRVLRRGDLLLEKSGGGEQQPVGVVVLYDHDEPALCSNFIARMQVAAGNDSRFLSYLHAALYASRVNTRSINQSTGIQNLDESRYLNERVAIPTYEEQAVIAAVLDRETAKIDALVARKRRLIELLQDKRTALITASVTDGVDRRLLMRDVPQGSEKPLPAGWSISLLDKLIDPHRRLTYGIVQPGAPDPNGRFMVRGQDYSRGWASPDEIFRVSPEVEEPYRRARLRGGDIVMTIVGAGTGNIAVVPAWLEGANLTQTTARIAIDSSAGSGFFFAYVLQSEVGRINVRMDMKGAAQPGLNLGHIAKWRVPVPPIARQHQIVEELDRQTSQLDAMSARVGQGIERLLEFRSALISAAVTGKIDVRGEVA